VTDIAIAEPSTIEPPFVPRPEAVLTTAQVARWLQISESQVRRLNLPCIEVGRGRFRYVAGQVLEAMRARANT
jgi:hypothetical protein